MRLLLIQYAGDYREAYRRLQRAEGETYYGHGYVLEQLGRFAQEFGETGILCCLSAHAYDERLPTGVRVIGAKADPDRETSVVVGLLEAFDPTHVVILGPMGAMLKWAVRSNRRILCLCADSFAISALRRFIRYGRIHQLLNDDAVDWVANHGLNASRSLAEIGVRRTKIVPWDWPHSRQPNELPPKMSAGAAPYTLFFAGAVSKHKGVGDLIDAVALLCSRGRKVRARIAGAGNVEAFLAQAARLGIAAQIEFLGLVPNKDILQHMREAAAVVVPSRHIYPEGMPLTIYEALCSRTPIIASDHPMFIYNLVQGESAVVYRAGHPDELAAGVERILDNGTLYRRISQSSQAAWEALQIECKWGDLLHRWLRNRDEDRRWLADHTLDAVRPPAPA